MKGEIREIEMTVGTDLEEGDVDGSEGGWRGSRGGGGR
jgi:hypothetical protein